MFSSRGTTTLPITDRCRGRSDDSLGHKIENVLVLDQYDPRSRGLAFIGAFAERHEGAVPVFVRGSDTLIRASFVLERAGMHHD
jgi:hypothetical protein